MDARKIASKALWVIIPLIAIVIIYLGISAVRGWHTDDPKPLSQLTNHDIWLMVIIHAVLSGSMASK